MAKRKPKQTDSTKSFLRGIEGLFEVLVFSVIYYFIWRNGYDSGLFPAYLGYGKYILTGIYALLVLMFMFYFDGFKIGYLRLSEVLISQTIAIFLADFITYWQLCLIANVVISVIPMLVLLVVNVLVSFFLTYIFSVIYHKIYAPENIAMVFGNDDAVTLKLKMDVRCDKYRITKLISASEGLELICRKIKDYDAVVINDIPAQLRNDILKYCYKNGIRAYIAPKLSDIMIRGSKEINLFDTPLFVNEGLGLTPPQRAIKRFFDIVISALAIIITSPIMGIVALAIKIEDGGPVLFRQKRETINGRVFEILKFRSMVVDAEKSGVSIPATECDPRITKVGRITRPARLDELPQLFNIFMGDMSIVGPRPERVEHMEKYSREIPEFSLRLKVKSGLTGYAQIYGKYNTSPYDKLRLDLLYIEKYSFWLDIKLILITVRVLLKKDSTEGFDKIEEMERLKEEALQELEEEKAAGEVRDSE